MGLKKDEDIKKLRKKSVGGEAKKCRMKGGEKPTALHPG